jgi:hypothetical protein
MEQTRPPGDIIRRRLSTQGSASISELARIAGTSEELTESIVRGFEYEGKARYHKDLQSGGAPYAEWVDGY